MSRVRRLNERVDLLFQSLDNIRAWVRSIHDLVSANTELGRIQDEQIRLLTKRLDLQARTIASLSAPIVQAHSVAVEQPVSSMLEELYPDKESG